MSKLYAIQYIRSALSGDELPVPEFQQAGDWMDLLTAIHTNSLTVQQTQEARSIAARIAWNTYRQMDPETAGKLAVENAMPPGVKVYGQGNGWALIHASDLTHLPEARWLIEGKIPENGLTVLYGPSGTYKSFIALDYALQIAQGRTVVYMAGEGELGYRIRVSAWVKHHKKDVANLYLALGAVPVMDNIELGDFVAAVEPLNPQFIVIDTLARAMVGADENSSRDMGLFLRACDHFKALGASVLLIHHTNKAGQEERGSGALRGAADSMIRVSALDDEVEVECAKSKDKEPFKTERYRFIQIDESGVLVPSERVADDKADVCKLTKTQRAVLAALIENLDGEGQMSDVMEIISLTNRGQAFKLFSRLKNIGLIAQESKRGPYTVTESGRKLFESESDPE